MYRSSVCGGILLLDWMDSRLAQCSTLSIIAISEQANLITDAIVAIVQE